MNFTKLVLGRVRVARALVLAAVAAGLLLAPRVNAEVPASPVKVTPAAASASNSTPEPAAQAAVYCQLLGAAVAMGVGFSYRPIDSLALDVSIGGFSAGGSASGVSPALGVAWLSGGAHNLEVGAVVAPLLVDSDDDPVRPLFGPHVGYRYQPSAEPLFFRATLHGVVVLSRDMIVPWPGVAFGSTWDT